MDVSERLGFPSFIPAIRLNAILPCDQFIGFLAVYRVCMAAASFFVLLSLVMLCVWSSKDPRSYLQNGFWFFKWLLVIGLIVAFFFIPEGSNFYFSRSKYFMFSIFILYYYFCSYVGPWSCWSHCVYCDSDHLIS